MPNLDHILLVIRRLLPLVRIVIVIVIAIVVAHEKRSDREGDPLRWTRRGLLLLLLFLIRLLLWGPRLHGPPLVDPLSSRRRRWPFRLVLVRGIIRCPPPFVVVLPSGVWHALLPFPFHFHRQERF